MCQRLFVLTIILTPFFLASCDKRDATKTVKFNVNGHCEMCKNGMEKPLTKEIGVIERNWDIETKEMTLTFDTTKIGLDSIKSTIIHAGYSIPD